MARTRLALILNLRMVAISLHVIPCKMLFEIYGDMLQILVILNVLSTQDPLIKDLFCSASSGSEPNLLCSETIFSLRI